MRKLLAALVSGALLTGCATAGTGVLSGTPTANFPQNQLTPRNTTLAQLLSSGRAIRSGRTIVVVRQNGLTGYRALAPRAHPFRHVAPFRETSGHYLWASDANGTSIWQTRANSSIHKTGKKIVGELTDCSSPTGLKVDHAGDLWAVCGNPQYQNDVGTVNMYPPGATTASITLKASYTSGSTTVLATPLDVAFDAAGNVFVSNQLVLSQTGSRGATVIGGVQVFPADCGSHPCNGDIPASTIKDPVQNPRCPRSFELCVVKSAATFVDADANGNLYEDYYIEFYECTTSICTEKYSQIGVDQIKNPRRLRPKFTNVVNGMMYPGGVYTTAAGTILNVLDQVTHVVTQYELSPFGQIGSLGPTPGSPCGQSFITFNPSDKQISEGDYGCPGIDVGNVATNAFVLNQNPSYTGIVGVAYEPSDK